MHNNVLSSVNQNVVDHKNVNVGDHMEELSEGELEGVVGGKLLVGNFQENIGLYGFDGLDIDLEQSAITF